MNKKKEQKVQPIQLVQSSSNKSEELNQMQDNIFNFTKRHQATPYYKSYMYAYGQRPVYIEQEEQEAIVPVVKKPFMAKRPLFVLLIALMSIVILAGAVLSFVGVVPLLTQFKGEGVEVTKIGLDDIVYSSLKKFLSMEFGEDVKLVFYDEMLKDIDTMKTEKMLATYMIIVTILLAVLLSVYVLIKSLLALKSQKKNKFGFITLLTFIFSVGFLLMVSIWNADGMLAVLDMLKNASSNINVGIGYLMILGASLLMWIFSWFAYRKDKSAKKAKKVAKKAKKSEKIPVAV